MIQFIIEPLEFEFMRNALLAIALAGINCAVVGAYVVLRRMAFMGGALAHTILPGMVFAFLQGFQLFWGALGASIVTALGVGWLSGRRDVREDTAIGVVLSGMFALGVLMMSFVRSFRDFDSLLFGSVLGVTRADLTFVAVVTLLILVVVALLYKELELASCDPEYSRVIGIRPGRLRYMLLILIALSVVSAVQLVGALLATALLITPAAAATLIAGRLLWIMAFGALIAVSCGVGGLYLSYYMNISSGASVVLCCTACFIAAWLWKNIREGLAARAT